MSGALDKLLMDSAAAVAPNVGGSWPDNLGAIMREQSDATAHSAYGSAPP
jgi:hypothetical protein